MKVEEEGIWWCECRYREIRDLMRERFFEVVRREGMCFKAEMHKCRGVCSICFFHMRFARGSRGKGGEGMTVGGIRQRK